MGEAAESVRLFFALWPESDLQARLAAWAEQAAGRGRTMRQENLHLTLAFLGDTEAALVPSVISLAGGVRFHSFELPLDRVGYWKHNRIIWCGASEVPDELTALVEDLRARLAGAGIRHDPKPFVSHITLVRNASGLPASPAWIPLIWKAGDFALVRSTRIAGRVSYRVLQRFAAQPD